MRELAWTTHRTDDLRKLGGNIQVSSKPGELGFGYGFHGLILAYIPHRNQFTEMARLPEKYWRNYGPLDDGSGMSTFII